ncbi:IpaC/SipC family type III secretion system effector [Yersinia enterocolitica]|uniref:Membrane protein n=1 Tax=Yersinia enterocolitica serotype O:8 / biotype 1B (strain NCTC 13174 / 8081) TaxID=393305 RepID=A1JQ85_YERE8|nr:IpaC/SipC family type III secretion system effector [Yersinia enterocolitica]AJJ23216.1 type III secretion target, IpaC/SipC family protein [Yersinia enterocolitica]CAL13558.1 membrane protein [Yersinia enterocolitica subsp. enterocolitica 8081]HDL7837427.1 IpaC/SipC family type III secretion system effector [Yersinia enterocolitica]HDL8281322.1 IpaC/SipC family type III secretion system effector [Yersinia enterocolitica]
MTTIQQATTFTAPKIDPNFAQLLTSVGAEQNTPNKLGLHDLKSANTNFTSGAGKPQLSAPKTTADYAQMLMQLQSLEGLETPENTELQNDLRIALTTTPEGFRQALTTVLQREDANSEMSAGDRVLLDALLADDTEQRNLAAAAQLMLAGSILKEANAVQMSQKGEDYKVESPNSAKQHEFIGFQTNETMRFMFSMLRKVLAELNISERRTHSMLAALSAEMTQMAADSTIREGKEIYHSAVIGFATAMVITGVGVGLQAGGLFKQSQAVKNHLKPSNQHSADAKQLALQMNQVEAPAKVAISRTGADGQKMTQATAPNKAEQAQIKQQQQQRVAEAEDAADLHKQKYNQQTDKYQAMGRIVDQATRMSDNAAQVSSASNQLAVKQAEADKSIQANVADTARSAANDTEKQMDQTKQFLEEIKKILNSIMESTTRANQAIVKG